MEHNGDDERHDSKHPIHPPPNTPYNVHKSFFGCSKIAFNSVYLIDDVKVNCSDMVSVEDAVIS